MPSGKREKGPLRNACRGPLKKTVVLVYGVIRVVCLKNVNVQHRELILYKILGYLGRDFGPSA